MTAKSEMRRNYMLLIVLIVGILLAIAGLATFTGLSFGFETGFAIGFLLAGIFLTGFAIWARTQKYAGSWLHPDRDFSNCRV